MNWLKSRWSDLKLPVLFGIIGGLAFTIGISIINQQITILPLICGIGFSLFVILCEWIFRNNP